MNKRCTTTAVALAAVVATAAGALAQAAARGPALEGGRAIPTAWSHAGVHQHFDARFGHNHSYFLRGDRLPEAPRAGIPIVHSADHFRYDHGDWYRHDGDAWIVAHAPIGVFVPTLPLFYTTLWFGGVPYYYANDTYYTWAADQNEYVVVNPPAGIEEEANASAPQTDALFVYPKEGQSAEQQSADKFQCYQFAKQQTGFDPTGPVGTAAAATVEHSRSDYLRADTACLEGRGYSVK